MRISEIITQTPEFKRWFGKSVVVDAAGQPLVCYHGTDAGFTEFSRPDQTDDDEAGIYFTTHPRVAGEYSRDEGGNIHAVYLRIENPFTVTMKQWANGETIGPTSARDEGHDGYIVRGMNRGKSKADTYIVFDPSQVRSIFA